LTEVTKGGAEDRADQDGDAERAVRMQEGEFHVRMGCGSGSRRGAEIAIARRMMIR
jgi:hypothetical protein